jgi:hypothetical protein
VRIDPAEVARQIAALGVPPNTDLLAARRAALEPPLAPPPEGQAPLLKVVK